jgi:hypothetical protein
MIQKISSFGWKAASSAANHISSSSSKNINAFNTLQTGQICAVIVKPELTNKQGSPMFKQ